MKFPQLLTISLLAVGLLPAQRALAQNTAFPVRMTALLQIDESNSVARVNITKARIVGKDRLILVLDQDLHQIRLVSVDDETNFVDTVAESTRAAFLSDGVFGGNLAFSDLVVSNSLFVKSGDGEIQIRGRVTTRDDEPYRASAKLIGIFNDSVDGNTNEPDILLKGELFPSGTAFDADEFGL